ncbi:MAG: cell surface receptor domain protein, partial [Prosthecobacter sp.]|nr:cell surface receptor domain protein [Prosthecobacter sp.]
MKTRIQSLCLRAAGRITLALMACLLTACPDPYPASVSLNTPAHGSTVTALSSIEGSWKGHPAEVSAVKLKISRYSDGKFWNGSSWGGSADLTTNFSPGAWSRTDGLPAGDDSATGLLPGYYCITATQVVLGKDAGKAVSIVAVGVTAPPVSGTLHAWGYNGYTGVLGAGPGLPTDVNGPAPVFTRGHLEGKHVAIMDAGGDHALAVTSEGKVYAWGANTFGQLGINSTDPAFEPVPVDMSGALNGKVVVAVSAGSSHSLAVTLDGLVYAWGADAFGALGNNGASGGQSNVPVPVLMSGALAGKKVVAVAAGTTFSL